MKVLMKEVGGNGRGHKKARVWNMAQFQPRRWHREQSQDDNKNQGAALRTPASNSPNQATSSSIVDPVASALSNSATTSLSEASVTPPQPHNSSVKSVVNSLPQLPVKSSSRTRVGKIARLPHDLRETVNAMLRGGFRYRDIAAHLNDLGHPGISENNISFWKYHGYMDWLARQHELESRATLVKSFEHCVRALDTDRVQQNALAFAAEQLCQVMAQYDHRNILGLLNQKPELFPKFVESMATLTRCSKDLAGAFAANQKSDTTIRSEMEKHPITKSLSEPISDADLDEEEETPMESQPAPTSESVQPEDLADSAPSSPNPHNPQRNGVQPTPSCGAVRDLRALAMESTPNNSKLLQPTTPKSHEPAPMQYKRT